MAYGYNLLQWTEVKLTFDVKRQIMARANSVIKSSLGNYVVATIVTELGDVQYRLDYGKYDARTSTYAIGRVYRLTLTR